MTYFLHTFLKLFFLLTPFAAVSGFISMTQGQDTSRKKSIAIRATAAMLIIVCVIFFFGRYIFDLFGITLDAFRIGGGTLLLLSSINLVRGIAPYGSVGEDDDAAVVPLAIPLIVGPGTIGTLFIMGAEITEQSQKFIALGAVVLAAMVVGGLLLFTAMAEGKVKKKFITVLSKITGLILASLASQLIMQGIKGFL